MSAVEWGRAIRGLQLYNDTVANAMADSFDTLKRSARHLELAIEQKLTTISSSAGAATDKKDEGACSVQREGQPVAEAAVADTLCTAACGCRGWHRGCN